MTAIIIGLVGSLRQGSYNALPLLTASSTPGTQERLRSYLEGFVVLSLPDGPRPLIQRRTAARPPNAQLYVSAA